MVLPLLAVGGALVAVGAIGAAVSGSMKTGRRPDQRNYTYNYDQEKDASYADQRKAVGGYLAAADRARLEAEGKLGPSVAEQQMQQGQQRVVDDAYQMASSARGGGAAVMLATRNAQRLQAQGQQQVAADAGILRAQERQAAQGRELQALQGAGAVSTEARGQTMQGAKWAMDGAMGWDRDDRANDEAARQRKAQFWAGFMQGGAGMVAKAV